MLKRGDLELMQYGVSDFYHHRGSAERTIVQALIWFFVIGIFYFYFWIRNVSINEIPIWICWQLRIFIFQCANDFSWKDDNGFENTMPPSRHSRSSSTKMEQQHQYAIPAISNFLGNMKISTKVISLRHQNHRSKHSFFSLKIIYRTMVAGKSWRTTF